MVPQAELDAYWCWFAIVQEEYQGQSLCRQMYDLVYQKKAAGATMALLTENTRNVDELTVCILWTRFVECRDA
ncbi:hypothetical protein C8Q76DRAFT_798415 [Earliella scabrosa]|nr:hypothetical protein C8Q76DRAFT_798415 [Earliella scabrosa]